MAQNMNDRLIILNKMDIIEAQQRRPGAPAIFAGRVSIAYYDLTAKDLLWATQMLQQTISFGPLGNKAANDPPFTLSATASSGLPIGFSSATPAACTIVAAKNGDGSFNPATDVAQSFLIASNAPPVPNTIIYLPITMR